MLAMIGHPVAGAKSPELFNKRFASLKMDCTMRAIDVAPSELARFVGRFRQGGPMIGIVTTTPHKAAVAAMADRLGSDAAELRLANAIRRGADGALEAEMFDGHAFTRCMSSVGVDLRGKSVAIFGLGASGQACAKAARLGGASLISVHDRDPEALNACAAHGYARWDLGADDGSAIDVAVNATPLGSIPADTMPFEPARLAPSTLIMDLASGASASSLLRTAAALGRTIVDGRQFAAAQFELLWGFLIERRT